MADQGRENWAVDELLKAEEEANAIIKNAQKEREKKIKEAKIAADQEISIYRREEENRYNQEIQKVIHSSTSRDSEAPKKKKNLSAEPKRRSPASTRTTRPTRERSWTCSSRGSSMSSSKCRESLRGNSNSKLQPTNSSEQIPIKSIRI